MYVAGAVEDASFPDEQKQQLIAALSKRASTIAWRRTKAHHGWVPPDSAVYNPAAAERHWTTSIALFDAKLKKA